MSEVSVGSERRLGRVASIADLRALARRRLPRFAFDFIDGGAGGERTLAANTAAFEQLRIRPRVLADVQDREHAVTFCGMRLPAPIVLAPAGAARLAGHRGELDAVRAASRSGTPFIVSSTSSWSIEEVAAESTAPLWFQTLFWRDRRLVERHVERARSCDYRALVVTVDGPLIATRARDVRNSLTLPLKAGFRLGIASARHPRWALAATRPRIRFSNFDGSEGQAAEEDAGAAHHFGRTLGDESATYEDLRWLRSLWAGPLIVKGVLTPEDAVESVRAGADGIIVSNHGGRQLDSGIATLDALPAISDAVAGRADLMLDGGVRRGSDIVKALACGAQAVGVGRAWLFGLAAGGEAGVDKAIDLLRLEFDQTLALTGIRRAVDIRESATSILADAGIQGNNDEKEM